MEIKCKYSEIVSLEKLVENPRNDNKHKQEHAELLAKVMKVRGIRHPIIVSKRSGFIVAGHLRLSAAKILGLNEFPIDLQDFENEADEYAFLTSDNNVARYAEIDQEKFKLNLEELDFNLEELDFGEFGLLDYEFNEKNSIENVTEKLNFDFKIEIDCNNENTQEKITREMESRGFKVRVLL